MYSQFDEERVIVEFFGDRPGKFLDVGAFDGVTMSNTRCLLEMGWSGVLVEPAPSNVAKLVKNTEQFANKVVVIQAAVAGSGYRDFTKLWMDRTPGNEHSNNVVLHPELIPNPSPVNLQVACMPMFELYRWWTFDFISIDTDWQDFAVLKSMPVGMLVDCRLLCIETRNQPERDKMKDYLSRLGFKVIHETLPNIIAANTR